jgi:hypothetical protein
MAKAVKLPKVAVWNPNLFDLSAAFKKIKDPLIRLALYEKEEGATCEDRYSGMTDQDWLDSAKLLQKILTGKYEEI